MTVIPNLTMTCLTKISVLLVTSALMLTASVGAPQPKLSISRFSASGTPSPCFVPGEIPTLQYTVPYSTVYGSESSGCVIKLRQQSDGTLVWRDYIPSPVAAYETDAKDLPTSDELLIPGLEAGNYTAEIWVKGRLENSLKFSVSGRTDYVDNTPAPHRVFRTSPTETNRTVRPTIALSKGYVDASIKRLDAFVGLTSQQKAEIAQIYLTANTPMLATPALEDGLPVQATIRQEIKAQIRARLTPEQQKLYDDDRSPSPSANPLVAKLDDLVNLTPGQTRLAEKIFANETQALEKAASAGEREKEIAIRQKTSAQIRTMLTPLQQPSYDVAPQSFGGGRVTRVASDK